MSVQFTRSVFKGKTGILRPISIIINFSEVLKIIIHDKVSAPLENNYIVSKFYFFFRNGRTTVDFINELICQMLYFVENSLLAQAQAEALCDLRKAFDIISDIDLLLNLGNYGMHGVPSAFISLMLLTATRG